MSTQNRGPLSGITVVDLSRILAGPYCTFLMAEMGARVIKVEPPKGGDDARAYGPFVNGKSTYFASVNRGKESIALDLKSDGDRAIFEKLLAKADVVVENFRPGTMEKLGFGWDTLHQKFPKLIYASASGFGHTGPNSKDPAYDMVMQGMGGIMSITGNEGQPPAASACRSATWAPASTPRSRSTPRCLHREKTGESTKVDIAMFDCQLALLENAIMRYTVEGEIPGPLGARHPTITPFQAFKTKDGAMIIAAGNDSLFVKMCDALGLAGLTAAPTTRPTRCGRSTTSSSSTRSNRCSRAHHRALDRAARQGRRAVRADQQRRAGDRPSAGRRAQHAGRGARRQRRHAEARRQSPEDVGLRRSQDPARRPRPRRRPRRHPVVRRRLTGADAGPPDWPGWQSCWPAWCWPCWCSAPAPTSRCEAPCRAYAGHSRSRG